MNRFYHEKSYGFWKQILVLALFLSALCGFVYGLSSISGKTAEAQAETLERAISRGIAHCYASEGHYPESLSYLLEHYDISYDKDIFFIDYQVLGENIFPDVTIICKQELK